MTNVTTYLGLFSLMQIFLPIILILIVLFFIVKTVKKYEKRADERLRLEKQHIESNLKQLDEIHQKIDNIEKMLKDIE